VQDACSTDETPNILDRHNQLFNHVDIRSDHGQSDAIDRGIQSARGRFLTWLNADDILMPGALDSFRRAAQKQPATEWWIGNTVVLDKNGNVKSATRAGGLLNLPGLRFVSTYGPSSLFTRRLYDHVGGLDLSFHYMMDTDLWYRFAEAGFRYARLGCYLWGFRQHEASKTTAHLFSNSEYDAFSPSEYRQNAERLECHLRHGVSGGGRRASASLQCAKALRLLDFSYPRQVIDQLVSRGRHWSSFRSFT
jgi:GT2 family glycosyltransferase